MDPQYKKISQTFATNISALNHYFSHAWYKLTTRDMGPVTRCQGPFVPPAQPFQYPLPPSPTSFPFQWDLVRKSLETVMSSNSAILMPDYFNGAPYYGAIFIHLAYQSASTYRSTDYLGGANGGRIRFTPQSQWPSNIGLDKAIQLLTPVQQKFQNLSWADLIVLAGNVALDDGSFGSKMSFCPGRTDATDGQGSSLLQPNTDFSQTIDQQRSVTNLLGFTTREMVALSGRPRSPSQMGRMGYFGSWTNNPTALTNEYYIVLLSETWEPYTVPSSQKKQFKARGKDLYMLQSDLNLLWDAESLAHVEDFAADNALFQEEFAGAWTGLMDIDRFDGPDGNKCE